MALCAWREDWPPASDAIRMQIFQLANNLIDSRRSFTCRHPVEGPEELQCFTSTNLTHGECLMHKAEFKEMEEIKIQTDSSREYSLCRLDLHCSVKREMQFVQYD